MFDHSFIGHVKQRAVVPLAALLSLSGFYCQEFTNRYNGMIKRGEKDSLLHSPKSVNKHLSAVVVAAVTTASQAGDRA